MSEIITAIGEALGGMVGSITQSLTSAVSGLIYTEVGGEQVLSDFAEFAFTIFGLSLAISMVFFIVNWVKGKRK